MEPYNQLKKKRRIIWTKPSFCGSLTPIFQGVNFISRCHPFQKAWDQKCLSHFFHSWGSPATSEARDLGWNWWTGSVETGLFLQQKFSLKWNNPVIFHWSMMMGGRANKHTDTHTHISEVLWVFLQESASSRKLAWMSAKTIVEVDRLDLAIYFTGQTDVQSGKHGEQKDGFEIHRISLQKHVLWSYFHILNFLWSYVVSPCE